MIIKSTLHQITRRQVFADPSTNSVITKKNLITYINKLNVILLLFTQANMSLMTMSVYANWASLNQRRVAEGRVAEKLNALCEKQFRMDINEETVANWDQVCLPWLYDLISLHCSQDSFQDEEDELIYDKKYKERKMNVCIKYFGEDFAKKYEYEYSMNHDPFQMVERMRRFMTIYCQV